MKFEYATKGEAISKTLNIIVERSYYILSRLLFIDQIKWKYGKYMLSSWRIIRYEKSSKLSCV